MSVVLGSFVLACPKWVVVVVVVAHWYKIHA